MSNPFDDQPLWQAAREQFRRRTDFDMESHARAVTEIVAELLEGGEPGERETALSAAILHDVGIPEAFERYGSAAAAGQEIEGARLAREILTRLRWPEAKVEKIADMIGHHHQRLEQPSDEFKLLYDADLIVNTIEGGLDYPTLEEHLYTERARAIARRRVKQSCEET